MVINNKKAMRFDIAQALVFICMVYILGGLLNALDFEDSVVVDIICILAVIGFVLANHYLRRVPAIHWLELYWGLLLIFCYVFMHVAILLDRAYPIVSQYSIGARYQFVFKGLAAYLFIVPVCFLVQKGLEAFFPPYEEPEELPPTNVPPPGYTFVGTPPDDR